jgi:hypothetical protein
VGSVSRTVTWLGDDQLVCSLTGSFVVGRVLVTVVVDGVPGSGGVVDMQCPAKYHGGRGEECQPCPAGATCPGGLQDPVAEVRAMWRPVARTQTDCLVADVCLVLSPRCHVPSLGCVCGRPLGGLLPSH